MEIIDGVIEWVHGHHALSLLAVAALAGLVWWMRRPDPVLREGRSEFDRLTRKNRGKYDDLRPM